MAKKSRRAKGILPTLSQDLLDLIITFMGPTARLAVFRSCKQLRNAVLRCKLVDTLLPQPLQQSSEGQQQQQQQQPVQQQHQQLRTRLFLAAGWGYIKVEQEQWAASCHAPLEVVVHEEESNEYATDEDEDSDDDDQYAHSFLEGMSATAASSLLQLAAHSNHDVHVHIRPTRDHKDHSLLPWLSALLHPWLMSPPITPSLQHVTSIWLQDVRLEHQLPACIGRACPGLKSYTLWDLTLEISPTATVQPWNQLVELTLGNSNPRAASCSLRSAMLPNLDKLAFKGNWLELSLYECIRSFTKQLTSLVVDTPCGCPTGFSQPFGADHRMCLASLDLPRAQLIDQQLRTLLQAAPALQQLSVGQLCLQEDHSLKTFGLQRLRINRAPLNFLPVLDRLPRLPQLQSLEVMLFQHISLEHLSIADIVSGAVTPHFKHLHVLNTRVQLGLGGVITGNEEQAVTAKLQALARLIPMAKFCIYTAHINECSMRALGAARLTSIEFDECTCEPGIMAFIWSLMPATNDITLDEDTDMDQLQAICLSATRPVVVRSKYLEDEDAERVQRLLDLVGNKMVTLLRQ